MSRSVDVQGLDKTGYRRRNELEKVKVEAKVTGHQRGQKIRVFKYRAQEGLPQARRPSLRAHRLEVTGVKMLTRKPAAKKAEAEAKPPTASRRPRRARAETAGGAKRPAAKKPAAKKPAAKKPAAKKQPGREKEA